MLGKNRYDGERRQIPSKCTATHTELCPHACARVYSTYHVMCPIIQVFGYMVTLAFNHHE